MDVKQKEEFMQVFVEAFHEVMPPLLEDLKKKLGEKIDQVKDRLDVVERKLDNITDSHANKLDNHAQRISDLESKTHITP